MIYYSTFGKLDTSRLVSVYIGTNGDSAQDYEDNNILKTQITLGGLPIKLVCNGGDTIFSPLKPLSATITIVTTSLYEDMYSDLPQGVDVLIKDGTDVLFYGYKTPCAYNQGWEGVDELDLECISPISSLEYLNYKDTVDEAGINTWFYIIKHCLQKAGWYNHFYFPNNFSTVEGSYDAGILNSLYQNELNFFDDSNEKTPWTCKNVLEEFCKFFGVSLLEYKGEVFFIDYNALNYGNTSYSKYDIDGLTTTVNLFQLITIDSDTYRENGLNISYDEVYKKITVKDNLYEMKSLFPSILEEEDLIELHPNIPYLTFTWTDSNSVEHTQLLRIFYNKNYTHRFYKVNTEVSEYDAQGRVNNSYTEFSLSGEDKLVSDLLFSDTDNENLYKGILMSVLLNYLGAVVVKKMEYETRTPPKSYNWDLELMFSYGVYNYYSTLELTINTGMLIHFYDTIKEVPVMTLKNSFTNNMVYSTSSDFDLYLAIKSSSLFCSNALHSTDLVNKMNIRDSNNTPIVQTVNYSTIEDGRLVWNQGTVNRVPALLGGVGIYIHFKNGDIPINPTMSMDNDTNLTDNTINVFENAVYWLNLTQTDGYLFYIANTYVGDISLDILPPVPVYQSSALPASICFVSNFDVNFVSGNMSIKDIEGRSNKDDIIFTSVEDNNKALEFDDIELKINTQQLDKAFSYSSVILMVDDTPYFLGNFYDKTITKQWLNDEDYDSNNNIQEMNLVRKYYNHYSSPKIIYEAVLDESVTPFALITETNFNKSMLVDSYELDVLSGRTTFKLVQL